MSTTPQSTNTPAPCAIPRCQHIKANGVQCGSPALRNQRHCFFHDQHRRRAYKLDLYEPEKSALNLPTLEDANSIQVVLTEVLRLVFTRQIDPKSASLLLRALRLAAANVKFTNFDPKQKTQIVIDPDSVENRPLGATAWSETEGKDFDNENDYGQIVPEAVPQVRARPLGANLGSETEPVPAPRQTKSPAANRSSQRNSNSSTFTRHEHQMPKDNNEDKMDDKSREFLNDLIRLTVGRVIDPDYLDRPRSRVDKPPADNPIELLTP
jgi:hypothetical protein